MTRLIGLLITTSLALVSTVACSETDALDDGDRFRIINGSPTDETVAEYAATVALHSRFGGGSVSTTPFCSGTLISADVVLTAGHCCDESRGGLRVNPLEPGDVAVYFGDGPALMDNTLNGEFYAVSEVSIHPNYDPRSITNDLCLLRLSTPSSTKPVPHLPADLGLSNADAGTLLDFVGFGYSDLDKTEFGQLHDMRFCMIAGQRFPEHLQ